MHQLLKKPSSCRYLVAFEKPISLSPSTLISSFLGLNFSLYLFFGKNLKLWFYQLQSVIHSLYQYYMNVYLNVTSSAVTLYDIIMLLTALSWSLFPYLPIFLISQSVIRYLYHLKMSYISTYVFLVSLSLSCLLFFSSSLCIILSLYTHIVVYLNIIIIILVSLFISCQIVFSQPS